jgi:hypothetical protein
LTDFGAAFHASNMEQQKPYEPTLFFSIEDEERESFANKHFPASGTGSLFQFFKGCWERLTTLISPQTKIFYKLDSFLSSCFGRDIQNIQKGQNTMCSVNRKL